MSDRSAEKQLVKERIRLEDLVREVVAELSPRGRELWACCPFHSEDTPSFHVRPALGVYKCFGCGESGDVFSFVQKTRGVGFREALELLAERAGIELGSLTPEERRRAAEQRRQREVLARALDLFRKALADTRGSAARYLADRGFEGAILERFDVGFVPADFLATLRRAGLPSSLLDAAGFTRQFGGRIGFGIRDAYGALVGFGARQLGEDDGPKYVNTRETPWFNKGRLLYGLDKAAATLARTRRLLVMEGYTDVMMAHQRGLSEAVATMGTSFTDDHLQLVKSRVGNLVFVFDGDEAGHRAAERAVERTLAAGLECRVLLLPDGADPCDWFARHDRDAFEDLLAREALDTVGFLARRGLQRLDPGQPGGRESVAREVLERSRTIADPVRREAVVAEIARVCGVDRNLLRRQGAVVAPGPAPSAAAHGRPVRAAVVSQFVAVAGLVDQPEAVAVLDELTRAGVLDHPGATRLAELGRGLIRGGRVDPVEWLQLVGEAEPALAAALERVLMPPRDLVLPGWSEAVGYLRRLAAVRHGAQARRDALARPDLARDGEALRALHASLRETRAAEPIPSTHGGGPAGPRPPSADRAAAEAR